ncbi:MAG: DUF4145 domain-containing protein [bacterium]|nr:DUF4145 domain-containing protein [bacterium]
MSELVANCPRCNSKRITFILHNSIQTHNEHGWQRWWEAFCICRNCLRPTIFVLSQKNIKDKNAFKDGLEGIPVSVNNYLRVEGFISLKDTVSTGPPEHIPDKIKAIFNEGATCLAVNCNNASATMFRLCVDIATNKLLTASTTQDLSTKEVKRLKYSLGHRLQWLFDNALLPESLHDLSTCIKDDGNAGAHDGTLAKDDAEDLLDFTVELLKRLYTEPERLRLAKERREARRQS